MSRIGRKVITIPAGVEVKVEDGNVVTVKGPKGTLTQKFSEKMTIKVEGATAKVERPDDERETKAIHGLTRTLLNNMVVGVSEGFQKTLEIIGVGYRANKNGKTLELNLGYSHPVFFEEGDGITYEVAIGQAPVNNVITVKGIDRQKVGQVAANIREVRPPEPYKGKGVRYTGEVVRRKAGKTGK